MSLEERITSAMREAMKARDADRVSTLRMAMAAATNRRIELGHTLTDEDTIGVLDRQVKQRRESAELFRSGGRPELADKEEAEIAILAEFLPTPLTDAEIDALIAAAIATTGYGGYLAGPPLIGFAAGLTGLPAALGIVAACCAVIAAGAAALPYPASRRRLKASGADTACTWPSRAPRSS